MTETPSTPVAPEPVTEARASEPTPALPQAAPVGSGWRPAPLSLPVLLGVALLVLAGVGAVLWAWRMPPFVSATQATDKAYVRGQTTVISPQVNGYVTAVLVRAFEVVSAGQRLVQIDDRIIASA